MVNIRRLHDIQNGDLPHVTNLARFSGRRSQTPQYFFSIRIVRPAYLLKSCVEVCHLLWFNLCLVCILLNLSLLERFAATPG